MPAPSLEESWTPGKATAGDAVTVLVTRKTPPSSQSLPLDTALLLLALGTGLPWLKTMKESWLLSLRSWESQLIEKE